MDDERRAAEIARSARSHRPGPSRGLWIVALVIGLVSTIGFVVMLVTEPSSSTSPHPTEPTGSGFGVGVLIGLAVGVGVGYAIARQRQSDRNMP